MEEGSSVFIQKFLKSPMQTGSLFPSSAALARNIASQIDWAQTELAAELGAGTGAVTAELVRNLNPNASLHVFEKDSDMRRLLQIKFPKVLIHEDAFQVTRSIEGGKGRLDAVISCLPFMNFSKQDRMKAVDEVYSALRHGGKFVAFQYTLQMKKTLEGHFTRVKIFWVPKNFPPAFVYVCEK
jgi:phospholipid N-methyltransferase